MISFVIPAYNEAKLIGATIDAARAAAEAAGRRSEVIVVDDASNDATASVARAHGARVVPVHYRQIAAVRNAGARMAAGRVLVFLDADTRLPPATLDGVLRALEEGAAGGGARVTFDDAGRAGRVAVGMWSVVSRVMGWAAGCFIFATREAFEAAGGFDERYYASEEIYMSQALKRQGRFVILREAVETSGRKVRMYPLRRWLPMAARLALSGPGACRRREGLWMWYDGKRE